MTRDELLAELAQIAAELEPVVPKVDRLYARRRELFLEGQAMVPPIFQKDLARAAGVEVGAVTACIRKAKA